MQTDNFFQIYGMVSIALTWLAISFVLLITERNLARSVSHHAAVKSGNHLIFGLIMTASLVTMCVFMYGWFIPSFNLPLPFALVVGLAILLEFITTWIPLTVGWRYVTHQLCSYGAALLIPVLLVFMLLSPKISGLSMVICIGSLALMSFLLYLFLFVKSAHSRYLVYQNIYIAAFHISILSVAYIPSAH
jgi:hypothetical protein